jgi:hypothetical protein
MPHWMQQQAADRGLFDLHACLLVSLYVHAAKVMKNHGAMQHPPSFAKSA